MKVSRRRATVHADGWRGLPGPLNRTSQDFAKDYFRLRHKKRSLAGAKAPVGGKRAGRTFW